ncbi:hypothetical protein UF75_2069 [Desulfosporosinus sp. I2]|nr:hypothetical protein UF75_2069 [Desulfosporosinus sp. I2]
MNAVEQIGKDIEEIAENTKDEVASSAQIVELTWLPILRTQQLQTVRKSLLQLRNRLL